MIKSKTVDKSNFSSAWWYVFIVGGTMALGFLSGMLSNASMGYGSFTRPPLTPPDNTFSIVWPVLYFLTSTSFYLMLITPTEHKAVRTASIVIWIIQIVLNLAWPFLFFTLNLLTVAFVVSTLLTVMALAIVVLDFFYCPTAAWMNVPYALWLAFATYLSLFIALYN